MVRITSQRAAPSPLPPLLSALSFFPLSLRSLSYIKGFFSSLSCFFSCFCLSFAAQSSKKKTPVAKDEVATLGGPGAREGEYVFGVAHIFASFNDTFVVMSLVCYQAGP